MKKLDFVEIHGETYPILRDMTEEEIAEEAALQNAATMREATDFERLEAQTLYTALMTGTLLEG